MDNCAHTRLIIKENNSFNTRKSKRHYGIIVIGVALLAVGVIVILKGNRVRPF